MIDVQEICDKNPEVMELVTQVLDIANLTDRERPRDAIAQMMALHKQIATYGLRIRPRSDTRKNYLVSANTQFELIYEDEAAWVELLGERGFLELE